MYRQCSHIDLNVICISTVHCPCFCSLTNFRLLVKFRNEMFWLHRSYPVLPARSRGLGEQKFGQNLENSEIGSQERIASFPRLWCGGCWRSALWGVCWCALVTINWSEAAFCDSVMSCIWRAFIGHLVNNQVAMCFRLVLSVLPFSSV